MPTSQPRTLTVVHSIVQTLQPTSLIDLGVGHGKTGVLAREYLDIMQRRYYPESWQCKIYGVEVYPAYRNPIWDYAYDEVIALEGAEGIAALPKVDLILALDVWEHFEPTYAASMLELCLRRSEFLLISTPRNPLPQADVLGNAAERHLSKWTPQDFARTPCRFVTSTGLDWIMLLSATRQIPSSVRREHGLVAHLRRSLGIAVDIFVSNVINR